MLCVCPDCRKVFHRWGHLQSFTEPKLRSYFEGWEIESLRRRAFPPEGVGRFRQLVWTVKYGIKLLLNRLVRWPVGEWDTFIVVARKKAA
jgi:hypothetical protein